MEMLFTEPTGPLVSPYLPTSIAASLEEHSQVVLNPRLATAVSATTVSPLVTYTYEKLKSEQCKFDRD